MSHPVIRADFSAIAKWIKPQSTLLDLGCGDGEFLEYIRAQKNVQTYGFDMVVLSQTLQTIHETESILKEIVRVGKECVISFPNFAHWSHRIDILMGRMPVSKSLPYDWYNTPNVRVLTIADFEALASQIGIKIIDRVVLHEGKELSWGVNLLGSLAIYRVQSA